MEMLNTVQKQVIGWGTIAILIVIVSLILLRFSTNDNVVCANDHVYNATRGLCHEVGNTGVNTSILSTQSTLTTTVAAIDEPISWISIVFVAVIGIAILGLFVYMLRKYKG